jgi:hypothetical protein
MAAANASSAHSKAITMRLTRKEQGHYRQHGWVTPAATLPEDLIAPASAVIQTLVRDRPWPELLSGIHNPFGHHACTKDAWAFLDIAESAALLDLIEDVCGPDLILCDSELVFDLAALARDETACWPVAPLAGAIAAVSPAGHHALLIDITRLTTATLPAQAGPHYILRIMPATSHYNRDPRFPANRRAAETRPLVNYTTRPIWLVRGEDHGDNDFATGFSPPAACWAAKDWLSAALRGNHEHHERKGG